MKSTSTSNVSHSTNMEKNNPMTTISNTAIHERKQILQSFQYSLLKRYLLLFVIFSVILAVVFLQLRVLSVLFLAINPFSYVTMLSRKVIGFILFAIGISMMITVMYVYKHLLLSDRQSIMKMRVFFHQLIILGMNILLSYTLTNLSLMNITMNDNSLTNRHSRKYYTHLSQLTYFFALTLYQYYISYFDSPKEDSLIRKVPDSLIYVIKRSICEAFTSRMLQSIAIVPVVVSLLLQLLYPTPVCGCSDMMTIIKSYVSQYILSLWKNLLPVTLLSCYVILPLILLKRIALSVLYHPMDFSKVLSSSHHLISSAIARNIHYLFPMKLESLEADERNATIRTALVDKPMWFKILSIQKEFSDQMMKSITGTCCTTQSYLSLLQSSNNTIGEQLLYRLALHDLNRHLMIPSSHVKLAIFQQKRWFAIAYSLCGFIDSISFQLELDNAYMQTEFMSTTTTANMSSSRSGSSSSEGNETPSSAAMNQIMTYMIERQTKQKKTIINRVSYTLLDTCHQLASNKAFASLFPIQSIENALECLMNRKLILDPISLNVTQDVTTSIDILVSGMIASISQDPHALCVQYFAAIFTTLLALEHALQSYHNILRQLLNQKRHIYLSIQKNNNRNGGKASQQGYLPSEIQSLMISVDTGLNQLMRYFPDVLQSYPVPELYRQQVQKRRGTVKSVLLTR